MNTLCLQCLLNKHLETARSLGNEEKANAFAKDLLEVLKEAMNDEYDYISWWLYEGTDHIVSWEENGKKVSVDLTEINALYGFLVENASKPDS